MYAPDAPIPIYAEMSRINISPAGGRPVGSPNKTPVIIFLISTSLSFSVATAQFLFAEQRIDVTEASVRLFQFVDSVVPLVVVQRRS